MTRRCTERSFLLRPDSFVNELLLYVLGYAVSLLGLEIHAVVALSNHWHLIVTDRTGKVCRFFEIAHAIIARAMNCCRGRWGPFWEPGRLSLVELVTPEAIMDKLIYLLANPCASDLVGQARVWPGLITLPQDIVGQREYITARPEKFFDKSGLMPQSTRFRLYRPPGFEHLSDDELLLQINERLAKREREQKNRRRREKRRVLGAARVKTQDPAARAQSFERRRVRVPHIACPDSQHRIAELRALRTFRAEYRVARLRFEAGQRHVLFPHGTYLLVRRYKLRCRDPAPSA